MVRLSKFPISSSDIINQKIEYKQVKADVISAICGKTCDIEEITPDKDGYVTSSLLDKLKQDINNKPNENLSTIINIGVGQGKTTAIYNLIEELDKTNNYIILMVSPYKKLTEKDRYNLEVKRSLKVVHYADADKIKDRTLREQEMKNMIVKGGNIFITTVNTLFNNPGEDATELSYTKKLFSTELINKATKEHKKVVMVFDEFHVITDHFKGFYYHYLSRWNSLIERTYILSATFSEASIIASQFITELTENNAKIYYSERIKSVPQANLNLVYTSSVYSGSDMSVLEAPLKELISKSLEKNRPIHIISPYKELAKKIYSSKEIFTEEIRKNLLLNGRELNLLIGNSSDVFDEEKTNIGTTFYTGIDIKKANSILVIIAPSLNYPNYESGRIKLGIFSQGVTAIVQAIGRLRNSGDIFIISPPQNIFLKNTTSTQNYIEKLPEVIAGEDYKEKEYLSLNKQATIIGKEYRKIYKDIDINSFKEYEKRFNILKNTTDNNVKSYSNVDSFIEKEINEKKELQKATLLSKEEKEIELRKEFYLIKKEFPRQPEFTFKESDRIFTLKYESYGKDVMPYILYSAFHNQFTNCTLSNIFRYRNNYIYLDTDDLNYKEVLSRFFDILNLNSQVKKKSIFELYQFVEKSLKKAKIENSKGIIDTKKVYFKYKDKRYSSVKSIPKNIKFNIISQLIERKYTTVFTEEEFEKSYFISNIIYRKTLPPHLQKVYEFANEIKKELKSELKNTTDKNNLINYRSFSDDLCIKALNLNIDLFEHDDFYKNGNLIFINRNKKKISQLIKETKVKGKLSISTKKSIVKKLISNFYGEVKTKTLNKVDFLFIHNNLEINKIKFY